MSKHSLHYVDLHPEPLESTQSPEPLWLSLAAVLAIVVALSCLFLSVFNLWSI
jgi:hypothetical protein